MAKLPKPLMAKAESFLAQIMAQCHEHVMTGVAAAAVSNARIRFMHAAGLALQKLSKKEAAEVDIAQYGEKLANAEERLRETLTSAGAQFSGPHVLADFQRSAEPLAAKQKKRPLDGPVPDDLPPVTVAAGASAESAAWSSIARSRHLSVGALVGVYGDEERPACHGRIVELAGGRAKVQQTGDDGTDAGSVVECALADLHLAPQAPGKVRGCRDDPAPEDPGSRSGPMNRARRSP